ncbi:MAG: serine/threonine protein kinase [Thermoleophilaceae bacterium]|nr:serine/threonine protein kinase [Thermoleophilaceae bacterium]
MTEHAPTKTPTRRRRAPTEVAGHRLLRPLEGSHATWEIPSDDKRRMQLLVLGRARKGQERAARTAFHRQLRARTSLRHPHLAPVVGGGESPRGPYVVVSLPRSRTLSSLIAEDGPLEAGRTYRLLSGVADALDAAHTRWLIHTDLTPRAIFVEPGERDWAWLTDFGIAHNRPPLAFARAGYRSPEELRDEAPLPESNVYSLACVVYTCLSGNAPFARQSSRAAMQAQLNEPPPKLSEERPELPPAVDAVLLKALSKKPDDRQATAGELMREVGAALGVLEPGAPRQPTGRFRRRPAANGAAAAPAANGSAPAAPAKPASSPAEPARRRTTPIETLPPRRRGRSGGAPRAMLIPLLLVAIGGAGAAGWVLGGAESDPPASAVDPAAERAVQAAAAEAEAATAAEQARIAWLGTANDAIASLRSRRASDRQRLAAARLPGGQADRARAISRSYARARAALGDAPASVAGAAAVSAALLRAERAYDRLAQSAGNENRSAYRRAVASVRASEGDLTRALAKLGQPAGS